jgi:TonB family protein
MVFRDQARRLTGCLLLSAGAHVVALGFVSPHLAGLDLSGREPPKTILVGWRGGLPAPIESPAIPDGLVTPRSSELDSLPVVQESHRGGDPLPEALTSNPRLLAVRDLQLDALPESQGGYVDVELIVASNGNVAKVQLLSSNLPREYLDEIREAFLNAKFSPATKNGIPQPARIQFRTGFGVEVEADRFSRRIEKSDQ